MSPTAKFWIIGGSIAGFLFLCLACGLGALLLLLPALSRARTVARRTVCATNQKQLATIVAMRAAANADSIVPPPSPAFGGTWMCDQPEGFTDPLLALIPPAAGFDPRKFFYCPANTDQTIVGLWAVAPYRVTGYAWTNDRSAEPGAALPALAGLPPRPPPPLAYHGNFIGTPMASRTELAEDWIISTTAAPATASWTAIPAPARPGAYSTSHMRGTTPEGGNILYFDGHIAWTAFTAANATPVQQGGPAAPYFWFPNP